MQLKVPQDQSRALGKERKVIQIKRCFKMGTPRRKAQISVRYN
jgi:hypothetical protein